MKLAILGSRGIPARYGGFETFAEELSVRLAQRGIEVTVYCEAEKGSPCPETYKGVRLVHLPAPRLGPLTTILFDLRCLWHARKAFDIVYMLGYGTSLFCFLPRIWGSRVWINMDGIEWARSKWNRLAKAWFKLMEFLAMWTPDQVIADAEGILRHLQVRHSRIPPARVIPYGAPVVDLSPDAAILDEWRLEPGRYYLVVCRLEPENSVREIVAGYLRSDSELPLVIVGGTNPLTPYVRNLQELAGDSGRVRFINTVHVKEKLQALRYHAKAYIHGHTAGGTNPSLLEALGCGNLVLAHDNVFNREVAGTTAVYFNQVSDVPGAIKDIETLSPEQVALMSRRARKRIERRYSWNMVTDDYVKLMEESLSPVPVPVLSNPVSPAGENMSLMRWDGLQAQLVKIEAGSHGLEQGGEGIARRYRRASG